jgi:DNA-directed RNA polymerase specialized sigma24 family protein
MPPGDSSMTRGEAASKPAATADELLAAWLAEPEPAPTATAERADASRQTADLLAALMRLAETWIRPIVRRNLHGIGGRAASPADVDDVCQSAHLALMARLHKLKMGAAEPIQDVEHYVARLARNQCLQAGRAQDPEWHRLLMKVKYQVSKSSTLAIWLDDVAEVCGRATDRHRPRVTDFGHVNAARARLRLPAHPAQLPLDVLIDAILTAVGGPLALRSLVDLAMDWADVRQIRLQSIDEEAANASALSDTLSGGEPGAERVLIAREFLRRVWIELCALALVQRQVLLLNLQEAGCGRIELLELLQIATRPDIAHVVAIDALAFEALWPELPLPDARVAEIVGLQPADIPNRRKSARRRLARRLNLG